MSKICGVLSERSEEHAVRNALDHVYDASWRDIYSKREVFQDGPVGLGHQTIGAINTNVQPLELQDGAKAVFCGHLVDWQKLAQEFAATTNNGIPTNEAELINSLVKSNSLSMLARLNGSFSFASWEPSENRLCIVNDRYGLRPIFFYADESRGTFVFSSDLRGVVASGLVERKVDWVAANTFLYFGHNIGSATLFEGVKSLDPASVLTFQHGQLSIKQYWDINSVQIDCGMSFDDAVDGSISAFSTAIARRRRESRDGSKTMVLLSGGFDSRWIAAELKRQGSEFDTFTSTAFVPTLKDARPARMVAEALNVSHSQHELPHDFIQQFDRKTREEVEYETTLHQWMLSLVTSLPNEYKFNYDGIAGDTMALLRMARSSTSFEEVLRMIAEDSDEKTADVMLGPTLRLGFLSDRISKHIARDVARESVTAELRKYRRDGNRNGLFILMNRTRRAIGPSISKLISQRAESFCPFLDNDFYDFMMSIPPKYKTDIRRNIVNRAFPALKSIPFAGDDPGMNVANTFPVVRQLRVLHRRRVWNLFVKNNWMYHNTEALPRSLRYALSSKARDQMYREAVVTFSEWLSAHFPDGESLD